MVRQLVDLGHGSVGREGAEEHIELVNGKRGPRSGDGGVVFGLAAGLGIGSAVGAGVGADVVGPQVSPEIGIGSRVTSSIRSGSTQAAIQM